MGKFDEAALIKEARYGDQVAFAELVHRYQHNIYRSIYARVRHYQDAEDICQETFAKAFFRLDQLQDSDRFSNWLRQIALNTCTDWQRRESRLHGILMSQDDHEHPARSTGSQNFEMLWEGIYNLSEINRQVVLLHYFDGYQYQELADKLGVPISTVRSRLQEARRSLRRILSPLAVIFFDDFESSSSVPPEGWYWSRPAEQEYPESYQTVEIDGNHALKLVEFRGQSAQLWTSISAEDFILNVDIKATHSDAKWSISAHTYVEHFKNTGAQAFSLRYHPSEFILIGGVSGPDETWLTTNNHLEIAEDGLFHSYEIIRRNKLIQVRRDGRLIASGADMAHGEAIGAISLSGFGENQGDGMGAYFDNVMVRAARKAS